MTDYKELIEMLKRKSRLEKALERWHVAEAFDGATDAIEELTRKVEMLEKQIDDGVEAGKKAIIGVERYVSQIQEKINSLDDHQHYSGRYIKSIMGVEE
ncbi:MAG: hypothetical protein J5965_00880 [Aeriscardovia sp.]|nr:hypothetical protein [Lachnospiraceae bacterium]MBO5627616.1 hypothetical protein [Aeriscardovia sp.]